jgi:uncharacterized protein YqeY
MSLLEQLTADSVTAMKEKTEPDRTVLRSLIAALKNEAIAAGGELDEAAEVAVLQKQLKQREEAAASYESRPELAKQEEAEAVVIKRYLPEMMSEEAVSKEVDAIIAETGASGPQDIGKVMGALKAKLAGKADLGKAAGMAKEKLQQPG